MSPLTIPTEASGKQQQTFEFLGTSFRLQHGASQAGKGRKSFHGERSAAWIFIFVTVLSSADPAGAFFKPLEPRIDFKNKTFTACSSPLTGCPHSDSHKLGREMCIFGYTGRGCPKGTHYGCGKDENTGFLVEGCFEKHLCPPGSSNRVRLNLDKKTIFLECSECDKDHFQPYTADSSIETLTGCQEKRSSTTLKNEMHTMVLIEEGWPTRPDRYACNVAQNYSDANQHMYCFVNRPCHCVQDYVCCDTSTPDLLPDRTCDYECAVDRLPLQNYSCPRYVNVSPEPVSAVKVTTEEQSPDPTESPILLIVLTSIGVLLVMGIVVFIALKCIRKSRWQQRGQNVPPAREANVEEPLLEMAGGTGAGVPRNDSGNRAESGDEVDMQDEGMAPSRGSPIHDNRNGNDTADVRIDPRRENPMGYGVPQNVVKTKTKATNQIFIEGGQKVIVHVHEQKNDQNPAEQPSPVHIAAEASNGDHAHEEPNLMTPIQEEGYVLDKSYSDTSIPLMDADTNEEKERKEISSEETEPKMLITSEETEPKVPISSEAAELQELKEMRK